MKNKNVIIVISVVILIIAAGIFTLFGFGKFFSNKIDDSFNAKDYNYVSKYYDNKALLLINLFNSKYKKNEVENKVKYAKMVSLFQEENYKGALDIIENINSPIEEIDEYKNKCNYLIGKKYMDEENYQLAIESFSSINNYEDSKNLIDESYFKKSIYHYNLKEFKAALDCLDRISNKDYEGLTEQYNLYNYEYALSLFDSESYNYARDYFNKVKGYKEANAYLNKINMKFAEDKFINNSFAEARDLYANIPDDTEFNGIYARDRKYILNMYSSLINSTGTWKASSVYEESKNVWKYDGRWENWYIDTPSASEKLTIELKLNSDGTLKLTGSASFNRFTNFSSLGKYCKASLSTKSFTVNNVQPDFSEMWIDQNTVIRYSNGVYSLHYAVTDDYSTNFYNVYESSVTYGSR